MDLYFVINSLTPNKLNDMPVTEQRLIKRTFVSSAKADVRTGSETENAKNPVIRRSGSVDETAR